MVPLLRYYRQGKQITDEVAHLCTTDKVSFDNLCSSIAFCQIAGGVVDNQGWAGYWRVAGNTNH